MGPDVKTNQTMMSMEHNKTTSETSRRRYGWRRQLPDRRDHYYAATAPADAEPLPSKVDLRETKLLPDVYNQGALGSCTANALAGAFEYNERKSGYGSQEFMPSRLFIYYNERKMEDSVSRDAGGALRDGIKSINVTGVCHETQWPYDVSRFTEEPSQACYTAALQEKALRYRRVAQTEHDMKCALHDEQQPVVFGFSVYDSFESAEVKQTGRMPLPKPGEKCLGGHAVLCVGYDDDEQSFIVRNSWGEEWGLGGYFYMPYEFLLDPDSASDFWLIETISRVPPTTEHACYEQAFPELNSSATSTEAESAQAESCVTSMTESMEAELAAPRLEFTGAMAERGTKCNAGEVIELTWSTQGAVPRVTVQYCVNSWAGMLGSWETIAEGVENAGRFRWEMPADAVEDSRYWVRVSSAEGSGVFADSQYFSVVRKVQ